MTIINKSLCCGIKTHGFIYMFAWISNILWHLHKIMTGLLILSVVLSAATFLFYRPHSKALHSVCTNYKGSRMIVEKTLKKQIYQKQHEYDGNWREWPNLTCSTQAQFWPSLNQRESLGCWKGNYFLMGQD